MSARDFDFDGFVGALSRRNTGAILEYFAEDVELAAEVLPEPMRGKDALRNVMESALPAIENIAITPRIVVQEHDHVAALVHVRATYAADVPLSRGEPLPTAGKSIDIGAALFLTINDDGEIRRLERIVDTGRIMQDLGITPQQMHDAAEGIQALAQR